MVHRLTLLSRGVIMLCLGITVRLFYLQIVQQHTFFSLGQKNYLRLDKIVSPRGNILDSNGKALATNRPITRLSWRGSGNKLFNADQTNLLETLERTCNIDLANHKTLQNIERIGGTITLIEDVPFEQLCRIIEQFPQHPNLIISTHFRRFYPHGTVASHVLGYLGGINFDYSGKMGLEHSCNETLTGTPGELARTVNSIGINLAREEIKKALAGDSIQTTIDLDLSLIAEDVFPTDKSGALIILNAKKGDISVLLSRPTFDPNLFVESLNETTWKSLQEGKPLINRVCNACYPPASLFKLVTMTAALETGLVTPNTHWFCGGYTTFCGRHYYCHDKDGHGSLSSSEALAKSCNIPFFDIAKKIKIDTLATYAKILGLGQPTGSPCPEKTGLVPTSEWKRRVRGEPWWPGETLSAAIGQSVLLVTPMQIARMIGGICEGFLVKPRLLLNQEIVQEPTQLAPTTLQFLKDSMRQVVARGSGRQLSRLGDIEIYAKTGTAQTTDLSKKDLGGAYSCHGWLATHVKYKNEEPFIMVIIIENGVSSSAATSVALAYLKRYCQHVDKR